MRCVQKIERLERAAQSIGRPVRRLLPDLATAITPLLEDTNRDTPWALELGFGEEGAGPFFACRIARTLSGEILIVGRDVTERRKLEDRLKRQALHDSMTGLPNRMLFFEQLGRALNDERRGGEPSTVALLLLDLDDFKKINDTLGHSAGDALLTEVARRLSQCLRGSDLSSRLGGDEFAVMIRELGHPDQAWEVATRILERIRRPFVVEGTEIRPSASLGIVVSDREESTEVMYRNADLALYRAKRQGKGVPELFRSEFQARAVRRATLKREIVEGTLAGEFVQDYQPIVDLRTREIVGAEVLSRWQHPLYGLVSPNEFIPIAEESGAILALGRHITIQAIQERARWAERGAPPDLQLAINLSRKQLMDEDLLLAIQRAVSAAHLPPSCLIFEVTEGLVMQDVDRAIEMLNALREMGIRVAMDDFGREYSSLSELEKLPIDILKVDKVFVDRLRTGQSWTLTETIIRLGHALGMTVVAEGIESARQLDRLRALDCLYGQGYLFSKPVPADVLTGWIAAHPGTRPRIPAGNDG